MHKRLAHRSAFLREWSFVALAMVVCTLYNLSHSHVQPESRRVPGTRRRVTWDDPRRRSRVPSAPHAGRPLMKRFSRLLIILLTAESIGSPCIYVDQCSSLSLPRVQESDFRGRRRRRWSTNVSVEYDRPISDIYSKNPPSVSAASLVADETWLLAVLWVPRHSQAHTQTDAIGFSSPHEGTQCGHRERLTRSGFLLFISRFLFYRRFRLRPRAGYLRLLHCLEVPAERCDL